MRIGMPELLVILAIVIVLFGARRLPDIGSGLAKAIKGFRKGISDDERPADDGDEASPPPPEGKDGQ
ncbi:MAG TPA: twin-arginine translocase TatA/TatE family subunit [Mariprofundaceae bacterium]|nr:twin-arginine translocase TatA/TatE family subunit [Mariprofundaceae bacterium]